MQLKNSLQKTVLVNKMDKNVLESLMIFKKKYPSTIGWRVKKHASVIQSYLNDEEIVLYAFYGQKNQYFYEIFFTTIVVITNKRVLLGRKRFFGQHYFSSITPDMLNDFQVRKNIIWGSVEVDTVKEHFIISNISKKALPEIEESISKYVVNEKLRLLKNKSK